MKIRLAIIALLFLGVALFCASGFARQEYVNGELTFFSGGKLDEWGDFYPKLLGIALQGSDSDGGGRLILELYYYNYYSYDNVDSWLLGIDSFRKFNLGLLNPYWGLGLGWPYFRLLAGMNLSLGSFQAYVEFNKTFAFGRIPGEQLKLGIGWIFDRTSRQERSRSRRKRDISRDSVLLFAQTILPNKISLSLSYHSSVDNPSLSSSDFYAGFIIERKSENSSSYSVIATFKPRIIRVDTDISYVDTELAPGIYYYRARAYSYVGKDFIYSRYSDEVQARAIGWVTGPSLEIINLSVPVYITVPVRKSEIIIPFGPEEVRGEVVNNGTVPFRYVEIFAKFYDYSGVLIGTKLANVLDLQLSEVWKFRILPPMGTKPVRVVIKVSKAIPYGG